eukprot:Filipodium_phascolosomae@DN681_c0_g1_i2.p1
MSYLTTLFLLAASGCTVLWQVVEASEGTAKFPKIKIPSFSKPTVSKFDTPAVPLFKFGAPQWSSPQFIPTEGASFSPKIAAFPKYEAPAISIRSIAAPTRAAPILSVPRVSTEYYDQPIRGGGVLGGSGGGYGRPVGFAGGAGGVGVGGGGRGGFRSGRAYDYDGGSSPIFTESIAQPQQPVYYPSGGQQEVAVEYINVAGQPVQQQPIRRPIYNAVQNWNNEGGGGGYRAQPLQQAGGVNVPFQRFGRQQQVETVAQGPPVYTAGGGYTSSGVGYTTSPGYTTGGYTGSSVGVDGQVIGEY